MDHEFFTESRESTVRGWDWFAIQLANNEELMLYRLRDADGNVSSYSSGSYVDAHGRTRFLSANEFSLTPGETWRSPHSGARYPTAWQIRVPSLGLVLDQKTDLSDQELTSTSAVSPTYWEGAVSYTGTLRGTPITGIGYLEMTGYRAPVKLSGMPPQ
jgi:predicted secreted hydrolase